jgi:hypothetical protein
MRMLCPCTLNDQQFAEISWICWDSNRLGITLNYDLKTS